MSEIYSVFRILPENLITQDIVNAAIEEANVKLLDYLPPKYMNTEVVTKVIMKDNGWGQFGLNRIPLQYRSRELCIYAVDKDINNIEFVPSMHICEEILVKLAEYHNLKKQFHFLSLIPSQLWTLETAYKAVKSICYKETAYGRGSRYHSSTPSADYELIQVLFSYLPSNLKTGKFYRGLFQLGCLSVNDLEFLIPVRHKQADYYMLLATKDLSKVPQSKYSYDMFMLVLGNKGTSSYYQLYNEAIRKKLFEVLDDKMADMIITDSPSYFDSLPIKFKIEDRLLLAISYCENGNVLKGFVDDKNRHLLSDKVCRAYIKKDNTYPVFPQKIWTQDFVDYCMTHGHSFKWINQVPRHFQTQEMVDKAIEKSIYKIEYADKKFITEDIAIKAFRYNSGCYKSEYSLRKHVPSHFLESFVLMTGLPQGFFGGEVSFSELRENRKDYTYCKLGNVFIGYYEDDSNRFQSPDRIMMTRRRPDSIRPGIVFSSQIGTYHKTWLEKLLADNDPQFSKPKVPNGLKKHQVNPYYGVKEYTLIEGYKVYSNLLYGEPVHYSVEVGQHLSTRDSLEGIKSCIQKYAEELIAGSPCLIA